MIIGQPVNFIAIDGNKLLLVKRSADDDEFPSCWSIVGGGPEVGETIEVALAREVNEEIGCSIKEMKFFMSDYVELSAEKHARPLYFYGSLEGSVKVNLDELAEAKWFDLDEKLLDLEYAFGQERIIEKFIEFFKEVVN